MELLPLIRGKDLKKNLVSFYWRIFPVSYILLKIQCFIYFFFFPYKILFNYFNYIDLMIIIRILSSLKDCKSI